jgi:threonine synthase
MDHVLHLRCLICGAEHRPDTVAYVCRPWQMDPDVGMTTFIGTRTLRFRQARGWRFRPLLPVEVDTPVPPILVGDTPLIEAPRLAARAGVARLWIKDEGRQPTASLKDRASAMAVAKAAERKIETITTASTGNAAAALAGMCAAAGVRAVIFVPAAAPPAKIAQLHAFGAAMVLVQGSYDQAVDLSMAAAERRGWYNRNTGFNPYMTEGKKTVVYEVCESLGWRARRITVGWRRLSSVACTRACASARTGVDRAHAEAGGGSGRGQCLSPMPGNGEDPHQAGAGTRWRTASPPHAATGSRR